MIEHSFKEEFVDEFMSAKRKQYFADEEVKWLETPVYAPGRSSVLRLNTFPNFS